MSRMICAIALAAAAGLAGCAAPVVRVTGDSAVQADGIGDVVTVGAAVCVDGAGDGTCRLDGASALPASVQGAGAQLLAAFLVPQDAPAADTATAHPAAAGLPASIALARRPSLDESLQRLRPAPAGERWVGYASDVLDPAGGTDGTVDVTADFGITRGIGGMPQPASFAHAAMAGIRLAYPDGDATGTSLSLPAGRPVDCDEQRSLPDAGLTPTTLCGPTSAGGELALSDLRGAGATVSAEPGQRVTMPFSLRYVGAPGPAFALHATTAVPGGTATPAAADLSPAGGFSDVAVQVAVPASTAPGDYAVVLTADTDGQVRRAWGTLTVTDAGGAPQPPAAAAGEEDPVTAEGAGTPSAAAVASAGAVVPVAAPVGGWRMLDFTPFDRTGLGADGTSVNAGEVVCHQISDDCGLVVAQLSVRADALRGGAARAAQVAAPRIRMTTIGRARIVVPAQGRRRVVFRVGPAVRRLLRSGAALQAVVSVRPAANRAAMVRRVLLRDG